VKYEAVVMARHSFVSIYTHSLGRICKWLGFCCCYSRLLNRLGSPTQNVRDLLEIYWWSLVPRRNYLVRLNSFKGVSKV
jgi:hypothetical protein